MGTSNDNGDDNQDPRAGGGSGTTGSNTGQEDASTGQEATSYPAFLRLAGRDVVLVGAGTVARGKLSGLLETGARITVVAPHVDPAIRALAEARASARLAALTIVARAFRAADLDGAWFVVAAAPPAVNRLVAEAASARRIFVNAVDDVAHASAHLGGVVRRGGVTLAVSTGGEAPALAGLLREGLDALLPDDLPAWLATARDLRPGWRADGVPMAERRPRLLEALNQLYARKPQARRAP